MTAQVRTAGLLPYVTGKKPWPFNARIHEWKCDDCGEEFRATEHEAPKHKCK